MEDTPFYTTLSNKVMLYNCESAEFLRRHCCNAFNQLFDAVITDPPFNIGQDYGSSWDDKQSAETYAAWFGKWFQSASRCLKPGGVFAINVPDDLVYLTLQQAALNGLYRIDWIIWHYRFGQCHNHSFISSHTHILVFQTDFEHSLHTWNPDDILVASDRSAIYKDSRTLISATPGKRVPLDVWSVENDGPYWSRVPGNSTERIGGHPNQLPEKLIERLVRAYTNPGDLVLEPFAGTGTTPVVCEALDRNCVAIEISTPYCRDIVERLQKGAVRV